MPAPFRDRIIVLALLLTAAATFTTGIAWGLPSRRVDPFLFGSRPAWTGEQVLAMTKAADAKWEDPSRGADVAGDVPPPVRPGRPILVNGTDARRAQIVRRYRLFTYQPDEMITLMSLAKMAANHDLDPRLYQYGGLWIYPVGALLKAASLMHLVQLRSEAFYLDHPEAFGRFYIVARLYSSAWGLVGVWAVFRLVRLLTGQTVPADAGSTANFSLPRCAQGEGHNRQFHVQSSTGGGERAGSSRPSTPVGPAALAALLFSMMPVVVNMAHEAKPHLPGAVIQLLAVLSAVRFVRSGRSRDALLAGAVCGAAFGMVLSTAPIFSILPLMTLLVRMSWPRRLKLACAANLAGLAVYAATNPYVVIHQFWHHEVFQSNVGNSTAMYKVARPIEGLLNEARLVADGMSTPLALAGTAGAIALGFRAIGRRNERSEPETIRRATGLLLAVPALLVAVQFALIGAGKPAEFGRFMPLPDTFLMIEAVVALATFLPERSGLPRAPGSSLAWSQSGGGVIRTLAATVLLASTGLGGLAYLNGFHADSLPDTSRLDEARQLQDRYLAGSHTLAVIADPAPYCLPPVDLFEWKVIKVDAPAEAGNGRPDIPADLLVRPVDRLPGLSPMMSTPISWAAKPLRIEPTRTTGKQ
jgi:hypothetical protein